MHLNPNIKGKKHFVSGCLLALLLTSCNITKQLKPGEYLVEKNKIVDLGKTQIPRDNIEAFIKQKPNRKILSFIPFNLWLYNRIDKDKLVKQKERRNARYDRINAKRTARNAKKNERRIAKGKPAKDPRLKNKDKLTMRENLLDIAEEPVIFDSIITKQTSRQLTRFLNTKGYLYARVKDSVVLKNKKAKVFYFLKPGRQFLIESIKYKIPDDQLAYYIYKDTNNCLIKLNTGFDADLIQKERERITNRLLDNGFYFFEEDYIYFEADSNAHNQNIRLAICAKNFPLQVNAETDSTILVPHTRYTINNIYIITENLKNSFRDEHFRDTLVYEDYPDYYFLQNHKSHYRPAVLANNIEFYRNTVFQKTLAERTYKRLLNLGLFRNVLIQFVKNAKENDLLDCYIVCTPLVKQAVTFETEATNTSGNLGIAGNLLFQNKNFFKGAELIELKLNGSVAAQKQFKSTSQDNINNVNDVTNTFNTLQFGPELKFSVPRAIFPFSLVPFKKDASPRTFINTSLNYQSRPEFSRVITSIDYGFSFKSRKGLLRHDLIPFEVYSVKAKLQGSFKQELLDLGDYFLLNSFVDHITTLSKYSITYNNQQNANNSSKTVNYLKVNVASSGNILRGLFDLTHQPKDTLGRYLIGNVPFAQFLKLDFDYRLYVPVYKKTRLVYRLAAGVGKSLTNLNVLPYEQSFFSGGPNSVRAWRARTLGPGGYAQPDSINARYDKIGDMLLEGNFEYRFHVFRDFYGAFFADAGNVWLLHKDPAKPLGDFAVDRFYKEIALGSGLGVRWDLSFIVVRVDVAIPIRDPHYAENDRWTFNKKPFTSAVLNFGIGYPF